MAGRKLKVYQARLGFYDTVVATSSRAAALRAWGVHQDLFADGHARSIDDAQAVEAALSHPDTPLWRAVGTEDAFAIKATSLPKMPDAPKSRVVVAPAKPAKPAKQAVPPKPPADRSTLDAAEAAVRALDEERKKEEAALRVRQDELDAARAAAQQAYTERRQRVTSAVVAARQAYRAAGGED